METLTLLLQLVFRSFVVLLPIVVGGLAFRRLALSKSSNAWVYAVTCLFAAVTTAGLLPWVLGTGISNWIFFVLAAFCPGVWYTITIICDVSRGGSYSSDSDVVQTVLFKASRKAAPAPLLLNDPIKDVPIPVFSHHAPAKMPVAPVSPLVLHAESRRPPVETPENSLPEKRKKSVLDVAREMRRNASSEDRRTKLLPAPSLNELPFIKSASTT